MDALRQAKSMCVCVCLWLKGVAAHALVQVRRGPSNDFTTGKRVPQTHAAEGDKDVTTARALKKPEGERGWTERHMREEMLGNCNAMYSNRPFKSARMLHEG